MSDFAERITEVLAPYGITTTEDFWRRYHTDEMIHRLVTIAVAQADAHKLIAKEAFEKGVTATLDRLEKQIP